MSEQSNPASTRPVGADRPNQPARPDRINSWIPVFLEANSDRIRTEATVKSYREILGALARDLGRTKVHEVSEERLVAWVKGDGRSLSPNWILNRRGRVQRFFRWMYEEKHIPDDPSVRLHRLVNPPSRNVRSGEWLTPAEALGVLDRCPGDLVGQRDRFVLALLLFTGLRSFEALQLQWRHVDLERREIRVHGKGEKPGLVGIPEQLVEEIARWLTVADGEVRPEHYVICGVRCSWQGRGERGSWVAWHRPIGRSALRRILVATSEREGRVIRPHDLRRTLAGILEESGMPIDEIAAVLRHNSTATTGPTVPVGCGWGRCGEPCSIIAPRV